MTAHIGRPSWLAERPGNAVVGLFWYGRTVFYRDPAVTAELGFCPAGTVLGPPELDEGLGELVTPVRWSREAADVLPSAAYRTDALNVHTVCCSGRGCDRPDCLMYDTPLPASTRP